MATPDTSSAASPDPALPDVDTTLLDRRLLAAQVDIAILGVFALGLVWFAGPLTQSPDPLWKPLAIAMAAACAVELFTGYSAGKRFAGLQLVGRDGGRATWLATFVRGAVRLAPVAVFVIALIVRRSPLDIMILFAAFVVACCYVSLCYVMFMRVGLTLFDAAAGTRWVAR